MRISTYLTTLIAIGVVVAVEAQTAQTPKPRPRPRPTGTHVVVRDVSGNPLSGVTVSVTGPAKAQATTGGDGTADLTLAAGS